MATEDSTAIKTETQSTGNVFTTRNAMLKLWKRSAPSLTKEELKWFSQATESADIEIISLKETISRVGCLIASDEMSGSIQSRESVSDLLFLIANSLDCIYGLINIGISADDRLQNPELYRQLDSFDADK